MSRDLFGNLSQDDISRIIQMAWEDRTSFDSIERQFGLTPNQVIQLMRREMQPSSFKMCGNVPLGEQRSTSSNAATRLVDFDARIKRGRDLGSSC